MVFEIESFLTSLGFGDVVLWLLTFAIVFGVLKQAKIPQHSASQAIIALVIAFFVLLGSPAALRSVISEMSLSLILVVVGILVLVIIAEVVGIKVPVKRIVIKQDKDGKPIPVEEDVPVSIFEGYFYYFVILFLIIAGIVFVNSGGLALIGISAPNIPPMNWTGLGIIVVIVVAVIWMIAEKPK